MKGQIYSFILFFYLLILLRGEGGGGWSTEVQKHSQRKNN